MTKRIQIKPFALKQALFGSIFLIYTGCTGSSSSSSFGTPQLNNGTTIAGVSDGIVSNDYFYVGVSSASNPTAHVHDMNNFNTTCSAAPTDSHKDITCYIEIPEGDLFVNGLALVYNVPPQMCKHFLRKTYWFYNQEVGYGPRDIQVNVNQTTATANGTTTTTINSRTCTVDGVTAPCSNTFKEVVFDDTASNPTCVYNKSAWKNGANCCFGNYTMTTNVVDTGGPAPTTSVVEANWGGQMGSCIEGAGKTDWAFTSADGIPMSVVEFAYNGISSTYSVTAPLSHIASSTNMGVANYYDASLHTHKGFVTTTTSTKPYFIEPLDDRSGSSFPSTQDAYEFQCLDDNFEVIHRVRAFVREWDVYQDYANYISSAGTVVVPDRGGSEGAACDGISGPCNDFSDVDNFVQALPSGYDTTAGQEALRINYFPWLLAK